jgi:two-component system NarL family sensor kinase
MKRYLFYVLLFSISIATAYSQSTRQLIDSAKANKNKDFLKVIALSTKAFGQAKLAHDAHLEGESAFWLGVGNYLSGRYDEALRWYLESERQYISSKDSRGLAELYADMTIFYLRAKKFKEADAVSAKAISNAVAINDKARIPNAVNNRGLMFLDGGNIDSAAMYFKRSYGLYKTIDDKVGMSYALDYLASALSEKNKFAEALTALNESMRLRIGVGDKVGEAYTVNNIGELYLRQNKPAQATPYFLSTIKRARDLKYPELEIYAYSMLAKTYEQQGKFSDAYKAQSKYLALKEKAMDAKHNKDIEEIQTKYETNKKEQANKVLTAEYKEQQILLSRNRIGIIALVITIILSMVLFYLLYSRYKLNQQARFKDAMLEAQRLRSQGIMDAEENERQRLARELHDGIGQLLCTVRRQVEYEQAGADDQVLNMLDESIKEVRDLSHSMMPPYILNKTLRQVIEEFINRVNNDNKIDIQTEWVSADHIDIDKTAMLMLYRSVQEIISNIFKHARATKIEVQVVNHGNELNLMIIDNGVGFDKDNIMNAGKGLGLKNIQSRIAYIGGNLEIDTMPGKGVTYIIDLPLTSDQTAG